MQATTPEDNSFFSKRKRRAASGGTRTHDVLRSRQTALPAEPPRQLTHAYTHSLQCTFACTCMSKWHKVKQYQFHTVFYTVHGTYAQVQHCMLHKQYNILPGIFQYLDQLVAPAGVDDGTDVVATQHWDQ